MSLRQKSKNNNNIKNNLKTKNKIKTKTKIKINNNTKTKTYLFLKFLKNVFYIKLSVSFIILSKFIHFFIDRILNNFL